MRRIHQRLVVWVTFVALADISLYAKGVTGSFRSLFDHLTQYTAFPLTGTHQISMVPGPVMAPAEIVDGKMRWVAAQAGKKAKRPPGSYTFMIDHPYENK